MELRGFSIFITGVARHIENSCYHRVLRDSQDIKNLIPIHSWYIGKSRVFIRF